MANELWRYAQNMSAEPPQESADSISRDKVTKIRQQVTPKLAFAADYNVMHGNEPEEVQEVDESNDVIQLDAANIAYLRKRLQQRSKIA